MRWRNLVLNLSNIVALVHLSVKYTILQTARSLVRDRVLAIFFPNEAREFPAVQAQKSGSLVWVSLSKPKPQIA